MRGEMPQNLGFATREIHHTQPIGENMDLKVVNPNIKEFTADKRVFFDSMDARFEKIAQVAVDENKKLIDKTEASENSIIFQQEIIKDILAIKNANSKQAEEEAKKYWENYDREVSLYTGKFKDEADKKKVLIEFRNFKKSIRGCLATIRFFEEKGFKASFPSPHDDKFNKCDLLFEKSGKKNNGFNLGVQLKSYHSEAVNARDGARKAENAISTNRNMLSDKEQQTDFSILQNYCGKLSKTAGKKYFPIFINMPVSMDVLNP